MLDSRGRRFLGILWLAAVVGWWVLPEPDLPPGLSYRVSDEEGPVRLHWLFMDPQKVEISLARALNDGVGREKVSSIARRKAAEAAFNAGFFSSSERYDGDPAGILKIEDGWFSSSTARRGALGWVKDGSRAMIGEIGLRCRVQLGDRNLRMDGLNRERGRSEAVLYSWAFHRSTLTDPGGWEVSMRNGRIVGITRSGDAAIPEGGHVASFGPAAGFDASALRPGMAASAGFHIESFDGSPPSDWEAMDYIVSGSPILLRNGARRNLQRENKNGERHPRTAVGLRANGEWVVLAVDGRQPGVSRGMTYPELAEALKARDCRDAINLDGGGSTTLFLAGRIVNTPSDFGVERPVSDAILIRRRD